MKSGVALSVEFELHIGRGWPTSESALVRRVNRNDANGYYKALGLNPDATREEIKAAYHKMVKILHPDRGGDEELFRFIVEVANILLNSGSKSEYDSVGNNAIYLGDMEREELARNGIRPDDQQLIPRQNNNMRWACLTSSGFCPGEDTDAWIDFCFQVSPAVGYRGKIRVGVVEGGRYWPGNPNHQWGLLLVGAYTFVIFQRGVEPNRLHALCAMIELQKHLVSQIRAVAQDRERTL